MRRLRSREWFSVALLSVIIPVGSLTAFRLTGTLKEPPKVETITVAPSTWNMSRPGHLLMVEQEVENEYFDGMVLVNLKVDIIRYSENYPYHPSDGGDYFDLRLSANANAIEGFVYSMVIRVSRIETTAYIVFERTPSSIELQNLQIRKIRDFPAYQREYSLETLALGQPRNASVSTVAYWVLLDDNSQDHSMTTTLEAVYYNGTTYREIVMPIVLGVTRP